MPRFSVLIILCIVGLLQRSESLGLEISKSAGGASPAVLVVQTEAGTEYLVYASENFADWAPVGGVFTGNGGSMEITIPAPEPETFYRVAKPATWNEFSWDGFAWQ